MKWRPVIAFLFLFFIGGFGNEANAGTHAKMLRQVEKTSLASSLDESHPADITPVSQFGSVVLKLRDHRVMPGFLDNDQLITAMFVRPGQNAKPSNPPGFLYFTRLLLFPKHYFW